MMPRRHELCRDCATWEQLVRSTLKQFGRQDRSDRTPICRRLFGARPKGWKPCAIMRAEAPRP